MSFLRTTLSQKVILITLVILIKVSLYFLFAFNEKQIQYKNSGFIDCPDRREYLVPVDNFIEYGNYSLTPTGDPYAGRLPGFVFPYIIFRMLFNLDTSIWLIGFFILGMSILAALKLIELLQAVTHSFVLVFMGVFCIEFFPYFWHWDWTLHPYSLSSSCLIFSSYFVYKYFKEQKRKHLLYTGFFLAWLFMLRGFTFTFIPTTLVALFVYWHREKIALKKTIPLVFIFVSPFLVVETTWIARNFTTLHEFIPLQTSFVPGANSSNQDYGYMSKTKYSMIKIREMINCWGGDNFWYFKNADLAWFVDQENQSLAKEHFNSSIFVGPITPENLDILKKDALYSFNPDLNLRQRDSIENRIVENSKIYYNEFRSKNATYYYLIAPLKRLRNFLLKNVTQDWPGPSFNAATILQKGIKGLSVCLYAITLILFGGLFVLKFKTIFGNPFYTMLSLYTISLILVFMFIINTTHYTYFIYGFIPAVILNLCLIKDVLESRNKKSITV